MSSMHFVFPNGIQRADFIRRIFIDSPALVGDPLRQAVDLLILELEEAEASPDSDRDNAGELLPLQEVASRLGILGVEFKDSHKDIEGSWIQLDLADNSSGRATREALVARMAEAAEQAARETAVTYDDSLIQRLQMLYDRGRREMDEGRFDLAFDLFYQIYHQAPWFFKDDERVYCWEELAFGYDSDDDDMDRAARCLEIQARLQPDSGEAFLNLGTFYMLRENYAKAISAFLRGLERNPSDEFLNFNLAQIYHTWQAPEQVLDSIDRAIAKNPDRVINWKAKGDLLFELGQYEEATNSYTQALDRIEDEWEDLRVPLLNNLAISQANLGMEEMAIKLLHDALTLDSTDEDTLFNLSTVYGQTSNYQEAYRYSQYLLDLDSDNVKAHHNLASALIGLGKLPQARWHLYKALQISPDYEPVKETLHLLKRMKRRGKVTMFDQS